MVKFRLLGKQKPNFAIILIIIKLDIEHLEKGHQKFFQKLFHTHYCIDVHSGIEDWDRSERSVQYRTHVQLKERNLFDNIDLKSFTQ